jgi:hypothetical protein
LLVGLHLGGLVPSGTLPLSYTANTSAVTSVDMASVSNAGPAVAVDGGLRFARHWLLGVTVEHASLGQGKDLSTIPDTTSDSAESNLLGLLLSYIGNPERASFYGEVGIANRWYQFSQTVSGMHRSTNYSTPEFLVGLGIWIPVGRAVRLLPEANVGLGTFGPPTPSGTSCSGSGCSPGHAFFMFGLGGFYNADL